MSGSTPQSHLKIPGPFFLAPMAGITDCAFRSFMREMGADVVITELVSATGLKYSSERTLKLMEFTENQRPIGIQLFGEDLEHWAYAAQVVEQLGADFVDLNFGCPVPKVVKKGGGSAILKDLPRVTEVFRAVRGAVKIPVTVKVRTGWDENSRNTSELVKIAKEEGLSWVAIHGRTRAAGYSGRADWDYIADVKSKSELPIIGNGDITTAEQAVRRLQESGCDAVMIGRGCLKNPWIFQQAKALLTTQKLTRLERNFQNVFGRLQGHLELSGNERVIMLQLKKFAGWFSAGYPESGAFRKKLFQAHTLPDLHQVVDDYFTPLGQVLQADTSHESFLMGGHG